MRRPFGMVLLALLGWGGCTAVAGLDGLLFVDDEGEGGSGTGTTVYCGWEPDPTEACSDAVCTYCNEPAECVFTDSYGPLWDTTVTCPDGMPCAIHCGAPDDCGRLTVVCPAIHLCSLSCSADAACTDVTLSCQDGPCKLYCSDPGACRNVTVECGRNECYGSIWGDPPDEPMFDCSAQSSCCCDTTCEQ